MSVLSAVSKLTSLLEEWDKDVNNSSDSPISVLTRIAELIEEETEAWYKTDPDPFDDRHPGRTDPDCALGHLLKAAFKNDSFMNKLVGAYLADNREDTDLQTVSCRLLLNLMPGLEAAIVFQENEGLVRRLVQLAQCKVQPVSSYAIGLLGGAMEIQDIAANFKESNAQLVPEVLKRLHSLKGKPVESVDDNIETPEKFKRPFATIHQQDSAVSLKQPTGEDILSPEKIPDVSPVGFQQETCSKDPDGGVINGVIVDHAEAGNEVEDTSHKEEKDTVAESSPSANKRRKLQKELDDLVSPSRESFTLNDSNSSWVSMKPFVIGTYKMWPLDTDMQQRLLLLYLIPMGEYQELLSHVFEHRAMDLIFYYLNLKQNTDVRLAFESTKYLAALLCHKKFAIEFITLGGVERLLEVPRPSVAATGVSMCLYYMAYFEDAMERVCLLSNQVLRDMVSYALWLLECSHESGRCNATMFFSMSFPFRVILEMFDSQDGLRKLCNIMSTLQILNTDTDSSAVSEDGVFMSRQSARHVCVALKKYLEAQLAIKADQLRRAHTKGDGNSPVSQIPHYKANKFSAEVVQSHMEMLLGCLPLRLKWEAVTQFLKLGGPTLLLQLVAMSADWGAYTGKAETIKSALDVLAVCSVTPNCQLLLCDSVPLPDNVFTPAVSVLLGLAEGEFLPDPEVQKAALIVIINCVYGPSTRGYTNTAARITGNSAKKKLSVKSGDDLLMKMWENLRANNGIMVLLKLMMIKTPVTEADAIRALACKALDGLARSDTIKQIVSKLPMFNNGQLQMLMREPVLQDKRQEYLKFCKHATALIEKVSGKPQNTNFDISLERIRKADIVAQTKIVYQEKELLQLIQEHLLSAGLQETASILQREADLPRCSTPPVLHPENPYLFSPLQPNLRLARQFSTPSSSTSSQTATSRQQPGLTNPTGGSTCTTPNAPIRINIINPKNTATPSSSSQTRVSQARRTMRQKQDTPAGGATFMSPSVRRSKTSQPEASISLDKIVTEYLRKQHSGCRNPVVTCPPFSLLQPHMCPEPRHKDLAPANITSRVFRKSVYSPYGGADGRKCDRKYIYSRFRPVKSFRDTEDDGCFSCCTFSADETHLLLGTYAGELKQVQIQSGEETGNYVCHSSPMNHCETTRDGKLVLTCSSWGQPVSALWSLGDMFDMKHGFDDDNYMEFSKQVQDRIIGTKEETAHIYDMGTGRLLNTLHDQDKANNYAWNRATFNPSDDLVLNDGVLWDINSGKSIHKFDKFNPNISGVFHPNGLEIIINSEVWDLRTFHLLHTVPGLDQCQIRFNKKGDVIYGAIYQNDETDMDDDHVKSPFGSSFRTFDGTDYSNIATKDVSKNIFDLCTDSSDCYLAVVENLRNQDSLSEESVCRLYEVGRVKVEEDDRDQDDDDDESEAMNSNPDDDDDDDDDEDDEFELDSDELEPREDGEEGENNGSFQGITTSSPSLESDSPISDDNQDGDSESDLSVSDLHDSDSDDDDDILFELSDISNGPWNS